MLIDSNQTTKPLSSQSRSQLLGFQSFWDAAAHCYFACTDLIDLVCDFCVKSPANQSTWVMQKLSQEMLSILSFKFTLVKKSCSQDYHGCCPLDRKPFSNFVCMCTHNLVPTPKTTGIGLGARLARNCSGHKPYSFTNNNTENRRFIVLTKLSQTR